MTYKQVIRYFLTQAQAARELGIPQTTISAWRKGIPSWRQAQVESATNGKLKARKNDCTR